MKITLTIEVELAHVEGRFASKDELAELLADELEAADPGELEGDEGGRYDVEAFAVQRAP